MILLFVCWSLGSNLCWSLCTLCCCTLNYCALSELFLLGHRNYSHRCNLIALAEVDDTNTLCCTACYTNLLDRGADSDTQGVRIINLREGDEIASVAVVPVTEEEELAEGVVVEGTEGVENTAEAATTTEQTNE